MILSHLCAKINLDKYIAVTRNKEKENERKTLRRLNALEKKTVTNRLTMCST